MKIALITGITGQDGSYLTEILLDKGYIVHGIIRRNSVFTTARLNHLIDNKNLILHHGDLTDSSNLNSLISKIMPSEIYNLGAQSHVAVSFEVPEYTAEVDALGSIRILNAIRNICPDAKYYQASSSELFGGLPNSAPQSEKTPFFPKSPYAAAKLYAYWVTRNYRESYGIYACNGILFNHESPRRGYTFVTKKISKGVAKIAQKKQDVITLGNLNSIRDWGYAKEYAHCMWKMLQLSEPEDIVVATGKCFSVRDFVSFAFNSIDIEIDWIGKGIDEYGIDKKTGQKLVTVDKKYFRPSEVEKLVGDPKNALEKLEWKPKLGAKEIAKMMVEYDLKYDDYGYPDPI